MAILHLFRGIPGAGKSTMAHKMFPNLLRVENDMYSEQDGKYQWSTDRVKKAIAWCTSTVRTALENEMDVVVANTFTKRKYVDAYKKIAEECGAKFEVYRCIGNFKNTHNLNGAIMASFRRGFEDYPGEIIIDPLKDNTIKNSNEIPANEFFT